MELSKARTTVSEEEIERIFDSLKPVPPQFLIGEWDGGSIDTGHPGHKALVAMRWAGKAFRSMDDAVPIVVLDQNGKRVCDESSGHASVSINHTTTWMLFLTSSN